MYALRDLDLALSSLVVFRNLLKDEVFICLSKLLQSGSESEKEKIKRYADFAHLIFKKGENLSKIIWEKILDDENSYLLKRSRQEDVSKELENAAYRELDILQSAALLESAKVKKALSISLDLPSWQNSSINFKESYERKMQNIFTEGYGIFAKHHMFSFDGEEIVPVRSPDSVELSQLVGYEGQRQKVIENTKALLKGKNAANVLLYGDAGTGKSSTVKAVAREYAKEGLRLVEVRKNLLLKIPHLMEKLSENPLKFIIFIDDLSFTQNNEEIGALKAILEGSVLAKAKNMAVYATSNRRHIIRETFSQREGDDIHANETIQEISSLSERFGLAINFPSPNLEEYLSIVYALAGQYELKNTENLATLAQRFALERGGRSGRTAKQFIQWLKNAEG
ncbi:MAG: ATP-binding protein [Eubacteriales bacterium]|jgi:predicted AAA+ superfamily ATPase|nr:ATP-binding protein [Eubacteriales bacterium]